MIENQGHARQWGGLVRASLGLPFASRRPRSNGPLQLSGVRQLFHPTELVTLFREGIPASGVHGWRQPFSAHVAHSVP